MQKTKTRKKQTDVLLLSENKKNCATLLSLLAEKELTFSVLPLERFCELEDRLELIGTVIIDAADIQPDQQPECERIISALDRANIAVILLNNWNDLAAEKPDLLTQLPSASIEELWGRISSNIAYRKRLQQQGPAATVESTKADDVLPAAEDMRQQLEMAGRVQRDFLPAQLPNSDKLHWETVFVPAQSVSGDIYDITRLDEQHIGFYIADAAGHSMPAALLTMFLKHALVMRETIGNHYRIFSPSRVLKNLNVGIADQQLSGCQFATCCYCLLNTQSLKLTFARAGHPYPVLIRKGKNPTQLKSRGSLLGIFPEAQFLQKTIQLKRGDKLFLYSDGVEELIGRVDSAGYYGFNKEFNRMKDWPLQQMMKRFEQLVRNDLPQLIESDDVTAIGLEIL
jgi:hypothetical protein